MIFISLWCQSISLLPWLISLYFITSQANIIIFHCCTRPISLLFHYFPSQYHYYFIASQANFITISLLSQANFITISLLSQADIITISLLPQPISLLFHCCTRPISLLFHYFPRPISFYFISFLANIITISLLPRPISLLFHYFPSQYHYYFIAVPGQFHFLSQPISLLFHCFPGRFHYYFITFLANIITISLLYQADFITISLLSQPISLLFHCCTRPISLSFHYFPSQYYQYFIAYYTCQGPSGGSLGGWSHDPFPKNIETKVVALHCNFLNLFEFCSTVLPLWRYEVKDSSYHWLFFFFLHFLLENNTKKYDFNTFRKLRQGATIIVLWEI